jgi:RHS repeat-associated protein
LANQAGPGTPHYPLYVDDVSFVIEPTDYSYDANGRVIGNRHVRRVEYEALTGLMREIETESKNGATTHTRTVELRYSAAEQRVLKTAISQDTSESAGERRTTDRLQKTLYLHGTNAYPLCEASQIRSGTRTVTRDRAEGSSASEIGFAQYVYGVGGLIVMHEGANTYFLCKDHLGSARVILDQDNQVRAGFYYLPFGELIELDSDSVRRFHYLYTGHEFDWEIGLYNYRARMYDPRLGRFYAPDPATHQYASPYEYVGNNPINLIDPTGTSAAALLRVGRAALGGLTRAGTAAGEGLASVGKFFS